MTMLESHHNRVLAWTLRGGLLALVLLGAGAYGLQVRSGLGVTGLSREMPWGLYISQFTFLVGIGASAVTVILPYYVHRQNAFARALILGEIVAVLALCQALMCITVDLGKPGRILNVLLYASPLSMMFWDCLTLTGYLILSVVGLAAALFSRSSSPTKLMRVLALATIPWAIGIHVVTALLYAGLAARPAWMTAVLAPRFLATAFASGPALLILLAGGLARAKVFDIGREAVAKLTIIMTYAATISVLLAALEAFTALYSGIPTAREHLEYLYLGLDGHLGLVAWSYGSWILLLTALVVLLAPRLRRRQGLATTATAAVLVSVLIDKGLCLVTSGFVPSPLGYVRDYRPSLIELGIVAGIYAGGALAFGAACHWLLPAHAKAHEPDLLSIDSTIHAVDIPPTTAREPGMATVAQLEN
jgi:molybdopterin-containing oxidoreductase family membrane subunit